MVSRVENFVQCFDGMSYGVLVGSMVKNTVKNTVKNMVRNVDTLSVFGGWKRQKSCQ